MVFYFRLWNYIHNVNKWIDENDKSSASEVLEVIQIKYLIEVNKFPPKYC